MNTYTFQFVCCSFFIIFLFFGNSHAMTRQQLKNSGKLMKKSCMPKNDVTEDEVGDIEKGKFIESRNVMCYVACVYSMSQVVKNNKLSYDAVIKQVDVMFPAEMRDAVKAAATYCKDTIFWVGLGSVGFNKTIPVVTEHGRALGPLKKPLASLPRQSLNMGVPMFNDCRAKKYKDLCESSYWTAKCIYDYDAANFVFP